MYILTKIKKINYPIFVPHNIILILFLFLRQVLIIADDNEVMLGNENGQKYFTLSEYGKSVPLYISSSDYPGVIRALKDLQSDIKKVTNAEPKLIIDKNPSDKEIVLVGTLGKNKMIDELVKQRKLDVRKIDGQWESYIMQVLEKPMAGVDHALVIIGSDKRGTIYGIYDLSKYIGVSPWYWWADVHIDHKDNLYINNKRIVQGSPSVKYRGIFLNDEYPDLTNWIIGKYGFVPASNNPPIQTGVANYNHEFYTKLFELILRLKGNYLWPAMWNNAFNEDDPENPKLADEYGIVMGNSHQEPMLRAQKEWDRRYLQTLGTWNYAKFPDTLNNFWRDGIRRNKNYESIITIGLRGANDTPMAPGGPEENMALLEKIVDVQRKIINEEMATDATKVPQLWCLYKEVLEFYNAGMRVPDDITLLWAEDNWGNVRRLPTAEERKRSGGAGIYYHFDYHGGPRSYQWINTNPIPKIWDQLSLAKQYGADNIWIVNVGHFKGYEFPIEYFMELAWNTDKWTNYNFYEYTWMWSRREFGSKYAKEIADIISKYTKFNGRRKPELLNPFTYSLNNYQEAEKVVADYNAIATEAEEINNKLPVEKRDAFYELVLFPVKACAIVNQLYFAAGKNALYAKQGRASTNDMAAEVQQLFQADTSLMGYFNRSFLNGKWDHFMDQTHLGYTSWNDPPQNSLRAIKLTEIQIPDSVSMGISVEGTESVWPGEKSQAELPVFDAFSRKQHYIDIFNKGKISFEFSSSSDKPWIILSETKGIIEKDKRIWVNIDWNKLPSGNNTGVIDISGTNRKIKVKIEAFKPSSITKETLQGFVEGEGYVSIEAEHYTNKTGSDSSRWIKIDDYGHTLSAMRATAPAEAPSAIPGKNSPCLEYKMYLFDTGTINVEGIFAPTLNFMAGRGLKYAVSFDNEAPQTVTLVPADYIAQHGNMDWEKCVADNARFSKTKHIISKPGYHTLKIWMIDPGVVLQKIVIDLGGVKSSYLRPPESFRGSMEIHKEMEKKE
jgi:hypothetical protein